MLKTYTVSFFGHRYIDRFFDTEDKVTRVIRQLIRTHEFVEFLIGRDGDFDQVVSSVIRKAKRELGEERCCLTWVQPYPKAEYIHNEEAFDDYYDSVEVCDAAAQAHPKAAPQIRNQCMLDRYDLVVFYVEHESGGAYQTMKYAVRSGKTLVNLAEDSANANEV